MHADRAEFKSIVKSIRDVNHRANVMDEPSVKYNTGSVLSQQSNKSEGGVPKPYLPKLTQREHSLLFDNEGCLKCHRFFAGHHSDTYPYGFPSPTTYRALTQADVERAKKGNHPTTRLAPAAMTSSAPPRNHPVAAIMGTTDPNAVYPSMSASSVLDSDVASESNNEVSSISSCSTSHRTGGKGVFLPLKVPHLFWHCLIQGPSVNDLPTPLTSLLDNGSHLVLIDDATVRHLRLRRFRLKTPEYVDLAMKLDGPKAK
jgi:hypothetical protein